MTEVRTRKIVKYVESELPHVVDAVIAALVEAGAPFYARGTGLFRPVTSHRNLGAASAFSGLGATILVSVDKTTVVETATRLVNFKRHDDRLREGSKWKEVRCPDLVAEAIIARRGEWSFPELRAVVSAPTLRPDGTILEQKGYDAATGILFVSDLDWPSISSDPTQEEARAALHLLAELVQDFPFVGPADRSAALAMLLTSVVRPCLASAPMFGVSAPTPGTGKSKLVDIASIMATGSTASVLSAPREEDELKKQIGAALMAGDPFITLDNIEFPLRSAFLCQVLTQEQVSVRVLGESRNAKLPTLATFCATGNSLRFAGDLTRRAVQINLDAGVERPEDRIFGRDVTLLAKEQRITFVCAALTVLRAFRVCGGPKVKPLGSFEEWSDNIRSALIWLGEADLLDNGEKLRDSDPERERIASILAALPVGEWTTRSLAPEAQGNGPLAEALDEFIERGSFNSLKFGNYLRKHSGRIIDGRRVVQAGRNRLNCVLWCVKDQNTPDKAW